MTGAVTIQLDEELERLLAQVCERSGRTRSGVVCEALRRHLSLLRFDQLRERTLPFAEAAGYLTDEDIFRELS